MVEEEVEDLLVDLLQEQVEMVEQVGVMVQIIQIQDLQEIHLLLVLLKVKTEEQTLVQVLLIWVELVELALQFAAEMKLVQNQQELKVQMVEQEQQLQ